MKTHSDELAVFVQVVESGSFSRAAERLGLANSAVSRTVKRLEDKLSANLLNRTTRQLRLTEEGCRFFERARQILHDIEAAEAEILSAGGAPQGVLRVDSATPTLLHLVAPLVRPFCERYPQVSLLLTSSEGYIDLIERRVDIAIRAGSLHDSALRARHLFDSRLKLVAAPDYLASHGTPQTVADLSQHTLIGFSEPKTLNNWPFADTGHTPYAAVPQLSANSGETIRRLCLEGNGIACLSDFTVAADIAAGHLHELLPDRALNEAKPFYAVYYGDNAVSPKIRAFVDFLAEHWRRGVQARP